MEDKRKSEGILPDFLANEADTLQGVFLVMKAETKRGGKRRL